MKIADAHCDVDVVALARSFLEDENMDNEDAVARLSVEIQHVIEDFIALEHDKLEPKGDPPESLSDEEYAEIEEKHERVRDAKRGFDE
jgi:hypothetical protein